MIIVRVFSFFCQNANCAVTGCNLSKKHKLALYKTQSGEPHYVDHKVFFHALLGATYKAAWGKSGLAGWCMYCMTLRLT